MKAVSIGEEPNTDSHLLRRLGRGDVFAVTLNNIVGAGIFTLPAVLVAGAGNWSVGILLFTVFLVVLMTLCTAEVASRFDITGGPIIYATAAFGTTSGFLIGSLMFLSRLAAFGAIANVMLDYGTGLWPALAGPANRVVAITVFIAVLTAINVRGVTYGNRVSNGLTVMKAVPLVLLASVGLWAGGVPSSLLSVPDPGGLGSAVVIAFYACMGFEAATVMAGEVRNPIRDLPWGMIGGVIASGTLYVLLLRTCLRTVPDLAHAERPLADAASALVGAHGALLISITAVVSCAGTLGLWMMATPRLLYALAERGDIPAFFARVAPGFRTPAAGIVGSAVIVGLLTISGTFVYLATFSAIARLLTYASTCGALIVLRKRLGAAPVTIPFGMTCSVLALICTVAALLTTTGTALRDISIAMLLMGVARRIFRQGIPTEGH